MGGPLPVLFTLSGLASLDHLSQRERQVGVRERQGGCAAFAAGPCLALPLGELSPEVTERAWQSFLNGKINLCAHTAKIPVDLPVGESQNFQAKIRQELRTFSIICKRLWFIMLRAVRFNDQSGRGAVKVHAEAADDPLFVDLDRIFAQKKIPELPFVGCQFPAELAGIF